MIRIEELRVGNTINYMSDCWRVTTINFRQSDGRYETFFVNLTTRETSSSIIDDINGVHLTETLLLECGFKKNSGFLGGLPNEIYFKHDDLGDKTVIVKDQGCFVIATWDEKAKYLYKFGHSILWLHQLQNILEDFRKSE